MSDPHPDGPSTATAFSDKRTSSSVTMRGNVYAEGMEAAVTKAQTALHGLSPLLSSPPPTALFSAPNLALSLLHDATISSSLSSLLRLPESGSSNNPLCCWLYETFQSQDPTLQLLVLSYIPLLSGLYLARVTSTRRSLSGFEAILLALYSHETASRPTLTTVSVTIPKLSNPSIYHETAVSSSPSSSTELHVGTLSHALEPHRTLRATCRARVVGVALEMFYSKIGCMPPRSKVDFCESCVGWADEVGLSWEVMQPALRILGHCLMGPHQEEFLHGKARGACRSLYARALHEIDPKAILATQSLIRMIDVEMEKEKDKEVDYTEVPRTRVISI